MFQTTWAGDCSAWECDELGHLNMSFYFDKFEQARMGLFIRLGLTNSFRSGCVSTIRSRDVHIKYMAEARPGQPLRVESAILSLDEGTARIGHIMYHRDGRIAATLNEHVEHVYLPTLRVFRWPSRLQSAAKDFMDQLPAAAEARNLSLTSEMPAMSAAALTQAGAIGIGGGVFRSDDALPAGHVPFSRIFRRITTTLGWYQHGWPEFEDHDYAAAGGSAVVLEIRLAMHRFARVGSAYDLQPAVVGADGYIRTIMHNVIDIHDGESIASGYAAGGLFNLNTRKLTKPDEKQLNALRAVSLPDLAPRD